MSAIPKKVAERITKNLKKFQPVLSSAKDRDVNESDTVVIVTDMLAELFGYDKYSEITTEYVIRGTYCDLAIKVANEIRFIIEVKAIGLGLKEAHVKQAVDYAANKGVDWAILTNGVTWQIYSIHFGKPISQELVLEINFLEMSHRASADVEALFLLAREGLNKSLLADYHTQLQATNKYIMSAIILSDPVLNKIRREVRRMAPDVKVKNEDIKESLIQDVLKREVVVGEEVDEARKKVKKSFRKKSITTSKPNPKSDIKEVIEQDEGEVKNNVENGP